MAQSMYIDAFETILCVRICLKQKDGESIRQMLKVWADKMFVLVLLKQSFISKQEAAVGNYGVSLRNAVIFISSWSGPPSLVPTVYTHWLTGKSKFMLVPRCIAGSEKHFTDHYARESVYLEFVSLFFRRTN